MLADYHVHTAFSEDSQYPMRDVVRRAVKLGIDEVCFTEHVDYFTGKESHLVDYEKYHNLYQQMCEEFQGEIQLKYGVEFGIQLDTIQNHQRDFDSGHFDFVILSNHQIHDMEFWNGEYQQGRTQREFNQDYYHAIMDLIQQYKDYSVLGHLDMIKRYDSYGIMPDSENEAMIKEILKLVIEDGKGIELNTSCFRYGLPDLTPSRTILRWYYELGGRILTIGSDSHKEEDLGEGLAYAKEALKELGFREFCTFTAMKPEFHPL